MLDIAIKAAKKGSVVATRYFYNLPKVNWKSDKSPVTKADIETEKIIRDVIGHHFPNHGIIGEELPPINPNSKIQWVIDPIDGTRDFIRGIPFWAIFIAVLKDNKPITAVVYLPILSDLITAEKGKGTYINGKKTHVSKTKKLKDAYISHGQLKRFENVGKLEELIKIAKIARAQRSYGNFGLKLLLEGKIDAVLESYGQLYDVAAPSLIVKEAGGRFSDFSGKDLLTSGNGVWSNNLIHNQVIKILNSK